MEVETRLAGVESLAASLEAALREVQADIDDLRGYTRHVEPTRPRDGQIIVADGINFDPGEGPGPYRWDAAAGQWEKIEGAVLGTSLEDEDGNTLSNEDILNMLVGVDANLVPDPTFEQAVTHGLLRFWTTDDGGNISIDADGGENATPALQLAATATDVETLSIRTMPCRDGDKFYVYVKAKASATFNGATSDFAIRLETRDKNGANATTQAPASFTGTPVASLGAWVVWEYSITVSDADATQLRINPWVGPGASAGEVDIEWVYVGRTQPGAARQWSIVEDDGGKPENFAEVNVGGTLVLEQNKNFNGVTANGEGLVYGTSDGAPDRTKDGFFNWAGAKVTIPRLSYSALHSFATDMPGIGWLVYDTAETGGFSNLAGNGDLAYVRKLGTQFQYDDNTQWVDFTPTAAHVAIAWMETGSDEILDSGLFGQPVALKVAPGAKTEAEANVTERQAQNVLIFNSDFEAGDIHWTESFGSGWEVVNDPSNARHGNWVAHADGSAGRLRSNTFPVSPGERYFLSAWAKTDASWDGTVAVRFQWLDATGTGSEGTSNLGNSIGSGSAYAQSRIIATAPANAVLARAEIWAIGQSTGNAWVDDVAVFPLLLDIDIDALATTNGPATANADATALANQAWEWLTNGGALAGVDTADTPNIANGAVSDTQSQYTETTTGVISNGVETDIQSLTVSSEGGKHVIIWGFSVTAVDFGAGTVVVRVYRDSTLLQELPALEIPQDWYLAFSLPLEDTPGSGSATYDLRVFTAGSDVSFENRSLLSMELRR